MNQVAVQEAANIRYNMENFIGIWWSGSENDVLPAGDAANGYKALTFHGVGNDFPVFADIQKYVVDAGAAAGNGDQIGTVLYNRGLYAAMLAAEAAKTAQEIHGVADITPAMMRDAYGSTGRSTEASHGRAWVCRGFGPEFQRDRVKTTAVRGLAAVCPSGMQPRRAWSLVNPNSPHPTMHVIQPLIDELILQPYADENAIEGQAVTKLLLVRQGIAFAGPDPFRNL